MRARNPFVRAESFAVDFDTFAKRASGYDLLLDATDNLSVRRSMDAWAHREGIPWVYGSVEAFHAQVCLFERADFGAFGSAEHTPAGIAAPMVMQAASLQANLALRYLAGLPVKKDTLYYLTFDSEGAPSIRTFALSV
jgi:adenylyltransferase/sulfurtransferase